MPKTSQKNVFSIISAISFFVLAALTFISAVDYMSDYYYYSSFVVLVDFIALSAQIALGVMLLLGRKNLALLIVSGVYILPDFLLLAYNGSFITYSNLKKIPLMKREYLMI